MHPNVNKAPVSATFSYANDVILKDYTSSGDGSGGWCTYDESGKEP
ncbi:hypothetical protein ACTJJB_03435 [Chitinophaga sp. 22536]